MYEIKAAAEKISTTSQNWSDAWNVAGVGFGVVFLVLIVLAVAIWITGYIVKRMEARTKNTKAKEKKAS
ncbi:MAG: OadG family protein [Chloroflexi bacterium]|jgi:Na+-transporting methylmalonyl-CoA/oxaloacetate decarboxylase gamma subunit|nr:OadG family protein [Chloroflexota bacterium]MBT7081785.1 OadG family protein [Chloroflexota bacterium]MBT7289865.1 OadG family protein [Chloroflexota bacterium]